MSPTPRSLSRGALAVLAALSLAACATKKPPPPAPPIPPGPSAGADRDADGGARGYRGGDVTTSGGQAGAPVPGSERDFVVNAGDRIYFDLNEYNVSDDGRRVLDAQAAWLQRYPQVQVRIEGNCDERGTREYNLALGARRAEAAKAYLASRGVSPARMTVISYGKERPLDPGTGEDAYAKNRNAHTAITGGALGGR